jgi:hypothetical protein
MMRVPGTHIHRHSRATEARVVITRNRQDLSMRSTVLDIGLPTSFRSMERFA